MLLKHSRAKAKHILHIFPSFRANNFGPPAIRDIHWQRWNLLLMNMLTRSVIDLRGNLFSSKAHILFQHGKLTLPIANNNSLDYQHSGTTAKKLRAHFMERFQVCGHEQGCATVTQSTSAEHLTEVSSWQSVDLHQQVSYSSPLVSHFLMVSSLVEIMQICCLKLSLSVIQDAEKMETQTQIRSAHNLSHDDEHRLSLRKLFFCSLSQL